MEANQPARPGDVGFLRARAVVMRAQLRPHALEEARGASRHWRLRVHSERSGAGSDELRPLRVGGALGRLGLSQSGLRDGLRALCPLTKPQSRWRPSESRAACGASRARGSGGFGLADAVRRARRVARLARTTEARGRN